KVDLKKKSFPFQVFCLLALYAVAAVLAEEGHSSQYIFKHDGHHIPVHIHDKHHHHHHVDYYTHPKYKFEYKVKNPHTGDHKIHHEHRDGDSVKGEYSFHQPDGTIRHVHYHADKHTGFHADVKHSTHHLHHHH
ncbi:cuticle protein 19-like, partial [Trichoplusia ni]|uniref:Cuticle protein 19-like n=1 Tax=Trichoplusia ni TaxID=7111 RepID=A0A7E5WID4_TRINI